jgi:penicillin amidase
VLIIKILSIVILEQIRRKIMRKSLVTAVLCIITVFVIIILGHPSKALAGKAPGKMEGLSAPVEVYRDEDGVPHIYAENMEDLVFAEGYVHAQDRFWQMEFWRRIGSGRLSELFGEAVLGVDIYIRTVNFRGIAEKEYEMIDEETRRYMEAYSAGVNAYILNKKPSELGLEFRLLKLQGLDLKIEPWTPVDTLTWYKIMAEDSQGNMRKELYTIDLIRSVGVKLTMDYYHQFDRKGPFVINDDEITFSGKRPERGGLADLTDDDIAMLLSLNTNLVGGFRS